MIASYVKNEAYFFRVHKRRFHLTCMNKELVWIQKINISKLINSKKKNK